MVKSYLIQSQFVKKYEKIVKGHIEKEKSKHF